MKLSGPSLARIDRTSSLYQSLRSAHERVEKKDATTWGAKAAAEAAIRLNWVDLPERSESLLAEISAASERFVKSRRVVLCGMGGSSLGPEVIARTYKQEIFILDSTDPHYIQHALTESLENTVVIVSSKSGSTIETSSQRAFFEDRFHKAGLDPINHMVFVTDPGSPLDQHVRAAGYVVVNADPHVGGRFSVLSAFGLVPAAFIGAPIADILADARTERLALVADPQQVIDCAFLFMTGSSQYLSFTDENSTVPGLSDWIEQLIAESTGKDGVGRLPIASPHVDKTGGALCVSFATSDADLIVEGSLGGHFIFWEWVTALLGFALKIDPFNQPNVAEAKEQTAQCLKEWGNRLPQLSSTYQESAVEIFGDGQSLLDALATFIEDVKDDGYIAIMAYLDRQADFEIAKLQTILAEKAGKPTSFGWGPRFLHSTGQFHKGGQRNGSFLQITADSTVDFDIPGQPFTFQTLLMAQAIGDNRALATRKYPLLRLHLNNRSAGITQILSAAKKL